MPSFFVPQIPNMLNSNNKNGPNETNFGTFVVIHTIHKHNLNQKHMRHLWHNPKEFIKLYLTAINLSLTDFFYIYLITRKTQILLDIKHNNRF